MSKGNTRLTAWVAKASVYDALTLAVQMERGAVRAYTALAKSAPDRVTRAKFRYLAEEEREHLRMASVTRRAFPKPCESTPPPASLSEADGVAEQKNAAAAVRHAIRGEQKAQDFYRACAARCRKPTARKMFERFAAQEARHAMILKEELALLAGGPGGSSLEGGVPIEEDFWLQK